MNNSKKNQRKKIIDDLKNWRQEQAKAYKIYAKTSAVGLEFGLAIAVGALGGYFIDKAFSCSPYGLIGGVILGFMAAIKRLWLFSKDFLQNKNKDEEQE